MTKVQIFIHGLYPRSADLVQTSRDVGRKRLPESALGKQQKKDVSQLLSLQKDYSFDYIEDGHLTWHDIFRPIVEASRGIETGALTRWFDNNCFYRQPIITGKIDINLSKLKPFTTPSATSKKWKVTLPSPYTFAKLSEDTTTSNFEKTMENVTQLLAKIVEDLAIRGVQIIQLNEPAIPYFQASKKELQLFKKAIDKISTKKKNARLAVNFYFGDATEGVKALVGTTGVDIVGIDFYKTNLASLPKKVSFDIIAGVIDGRNSLLENEKIVGAFLKQVVKTLTPGTLYISNNSDLELLPEPVAREKLKIIHKLQTALNK